MSLVRHHDRRTGITYVYESQSYWDPERKQPRSHRTLVGKLDADGNLVPTDGRMKNKKKPLPPKNVETAVPGTDTNSREQEYERILTQKNEIINKLQNTISQITQENQALKEKLKMIAAIMSQP